MSQTAYRPPAIVTSNPTHGVHRCRACHCLIIWRYHERTRRLAPIAATPQLNGNVELVGEECYRLVKPDPAVRRYVNHFATCELAQRFADPTRGGPQR